MKKSDPTQPLIGGESVSVLRAEELIGGITKVFAADRDHDLLAKPDEALTGKLLQIDSKNRISRSGLTTEESLALQEQPFRCMTRAEDGTMAIPADAMAVLRSMVYVEDGILRIRAPKDDRRDNLDTMETAEARSIANSEKFLETIAALERTRYNL